MEYWLNMSQWAVMDYIWILWSWANIMEIDWENYFYLSNWKLVEELSIISDKKDTFSKIIKTLSEKWLIKTKLIDFSKNYVILTGDWLSFISNTLEMSRVGNKSEGGSEINPNNNYTNKINKNIQKEKELVTKEKLIEELNQLINSFNNLDRKYKFPKTSLYSEKLKISKDLLKIFEKCKKDYWLDWIEEWLSKYLDYIDWNKWCNHRFSLYEFIKQGNWLLKYLNK